MIHFPKEVYRNFLRFALENANPLGKSQTWRECIGLILGRIDGELISVTDIVPIGSGSSYFVDISDYEKVFSLISFERIDQGEVIVGWAHTHPGLGLFFSGTDIETQLTYQSMHSLSFGLVLDPTKIRSQSPGFNIYRVDSSTHRPYTVDYLFHEEFNFLSIYNQLAYELYKVAIPITEMIPELTAKHRLTWKDITLYLDGPTKSNQQDPVPLKLVLKMPHPQYFRVTYKIKIYNTTLSSMQDFVGSQEYFHESFDSGTLAIFSLESSNANRVILQLTKMKITDYNQKYLDAPDLGFEVRTEV
ncbi:MAG: Mov34/MPN/PAD-1 family protein [Candidatus Hodarchaeales archaeon]|jgi:proteasome lid subunit RPN8/RPN11